MRTIIHNHNNGEEAITLPTVEELVSSVTGIDQTIGLYEISGFRKDLLIKLKQKGWSDNIFLDKISKISITGEKDGIGLCLQTGNVSRVYADLLKLQALFLQNKIKAGVIILPTLDCSKQYASNAATFERLVRELSIFKDVITIPLVVIGFYS